MGDGEPVVFSHKIVLIFKKCSFIITLPVIYSVIAICAKHESYGIDETLKFCQIVVKELRHGLRL